MSPRGKLLLIGLGIAAVSPLVALKLISLTGKAPARCRAVLLRPTVFAARKRKPGTPSHP
jgi:hypothetical protein